MMKVTTYVALAALFAIPFIPLYIANGLFFPFITGKGFLFRILVEIASVAWLVLALADKKYRPRFSWILVLYGAFAAWMFVADVCALNPHKAFWSNFERMDGYVTLIHAFLLFVVAGGILGPLKLWRKWWCTFISVTALLCGYGLLQLTGAIAIHQSGVRLDATMGNSAYFAAYLLFALAITCWLAATSKSSWTRYTLFALALLELFIIFNTATRGAILGVVGAAGLCALLWVIESGKKGRAVAMIALAGVVMAVAGFWMLREQPIIADSPVLSRIATISFSELSTRLTLWDMAREGIMARPVTGYGQEGFNYVFNQFYRPSLYAQEPWFDRAHNVFVDWLVAGGIPAFVLFISLLISAVVGLYRSTIPRAERIFLTAGLAAYALQALVVFDNLFTYVPLAAILAMVHFSWSRPITWMEQKPALSPAALNTSVAPIALVVGVAIVWMVNIPTMQTAGNLVYAISGLPGGPEENLRYFKRAIADGGTITQEVAEQLVGTAGSVVGQVQLPESLRREYAGLAIESILKEVANAPRDARLHMQAAIAFRSVGENDLALAHIDQAIALSPKKQMFYLEKGLQLSQTGKAQEARDVFHYAYALDPSFPQIATYAAAGDILAGNYEEGKAFLLKEVGTTSVNSMALVRAYFETKHFEDLIDVLLAQVAEEPTTDSKLRLLTAYVLAGRVSDARAWGSQIIKEYPAATAQVQSILATPPA